MKHKRKKLLIEPRFQIQFILRLAAWVGLATVITAAASYLVLCVVEHRMAGDLFYVTQRSGSHATWLSLTQIVLPVLAISLPINLALTLVFALYYSNRLAGPVHRLVTDMLKVARGEKAKLHFSLRESDELQEVAHAFDTLLKSLAEKGYTGKR